MINYLLDNRLLPVHANQYGFIKGRSTSLQLLHIMDKWTQYLEQGGQIDVMYSDFEKAFDKVSHDRLIYKLKLYDQFQQRHYYLDSRFPKRQKI